MKYYRYTNSKNPMSDWGHAMFSASEINFLANSYKWQHTADEADMMPISELSEAIREAWMADAEDGMLPDESYLGTLSVDEIVAAFDPSDICDSAEAYDNGDLVQWLWDRILEPREIKAISTSDGAVVFDKALISTRNNPNID